MIEIVKNDRLFSRLFARLQDGVYGIEIQGKKGGKQQYPACPPVVIIICQAKQSSLARSK